jgi:hypothetical protein
MTAIRVGENVKGAAPHLFLVAGSGVSDGSLDLETVTGTGFSAIAGSGSGVYTITLTDAFAQMVSCVASVTLGAVDATADKLYYVDVTSYLAGVLTLTTKQIVVSAADTAVTAADLPDDAVLSFVAVFRDAFEYSGL